MIIWRQYKRQPQFGRRQARSQTAIFKPKNLLKQTEEGTIIQLEYWVIFVHLKREAKLSIYFWIPFIVLLIAWLSLNLYLFMYSMLNKYSVYT